MASNQPHKLIESGSIPLLRNQIILRKNVVVLAESLTKGVLAESKILADIIAKGYKVAIPYGHDWKYDLIAERNGKLERIQVKYAQSNGVVIQVTCRTSNPWVKVKYTSEMIDWIAVYDITTDKCYYIPASELGEGKARLILRIQDAKINVKNCRYAKDYLAF